ncbi:MAG: phosphoribosylanthranilate isomerase [Candidatus Aminicenantes bacterium]|nr:phosphoribosylanthranilate isomerase [Candidatus Aminicenantes bacterium]
MVKVKICGLTRREDLDLAGELGADFAGFVFAPSSPRYVRPEEAATRLAPARKSGFCARIGVFVNERPERIREIFRLCRLDIVQLHGNESPAYCRALKLPYWKVLRPENAGDLKRMEDYPEAVILLDKIVAGAWGGTGRPIDPALLDEAAKTGRRIIIAGGVSSENLESALARRPYGLDLSSSLEERPGVKNAERMRTFFLRKKQIEEKFKPKARP